MQADFQATRARETRGRDIAYVIASAAIAAVTSWGLHVGDHPGLQYGVTAFMLNSVVAFVAVAAPSIFLRHRQIILVFLKLRTTLLASAILSVPIFR